jgi:predicted aminopeptidase
LKIYSDKREFGERLTALIEAARDSLQLIYDSGADEESMRRQKRQRLEQLSEDIAAEFERSGRSRGDWFLGELNNAHLVSTSLYKGLVPAFRMIYEDCNRELECFYASANELAAMDRSERDEALALRKLR